MFIIKIIGMLIISFILARILVSGFKMAIYGYLILVFQTIRVMDNNYGEDWHKNLDSEKLEYMFYIASNNYKDCIYNLFH